MLHALRQHLRVRFPQAQQWAGFLKQGIRVAQVFTAQGVGGTDREVRHDGAPVVTHRLQLFVAGVFLQFQAEQAAGVEGMLLEHAVAETVDGVDGGFVHPLGGGVQALGTLGALLGLGKVIEQFG